MKPIRLTQHARDHYRLYFLLLRGEIDENQL
jgi:hypothetical protein